MIQFNLLPDVKMEYIKAQRTQRLVWATAFLATGASVILLVLLLGLNGLQQKHLKDLSTDITNNSNKLRGEKDIGKILTVQNQLESLTSLHQAKPGAGRLFDYLNQVTPSSVSISNFSIDFAATTVTITGSGDALSNVNQYVDTLKFTTYKADNTTKPAFGNVVLGSFGLNPDQQSSTARAASYTITLNFDLAIFDTSQDVKFKVPKQVSTRSEVTAPPDLFQAAPTTTTTGTKSN